MREYFGFEKDEVVLLQVPAELLNWEHDIVRHCSVCVSCSLVRIAYAPISHPGPGPDPSGLISQPASMLTSTGEEENELVTSDEEDITEWERRLSELLTGREVQDRTDEINAAHDAELEELRHARLDEEDEAKRLLCMACEVSACMNVLKDTNDKECRLHCQNAHRPMMQGCPSCEMAYM